MKNILIDGTTISRRMDGLSQYILNVVSRLPLREDKHYTIVVRPNECPEEYLKIWSERGMEILTAPIAPIGPIREWQFRQWLRAQRPYDVAIAPSNQYPLALTIPTLYVVHDIIYERYPGQLGKFAAAKRQWLHYNVAKGLQLASHVVAVSQFTKNEILHFHPQADPQKISVVYEGWEHLKNQDSEDSIVAPFKNFILYIGSSRGHKNMTGLLEAMMLVKEKLPADTGLVIVGDDSMLSEEQYKKINQLKEKVVTTGWLNQAALISYCKLAQAVIFPSLCEGFGIPVLEAFYFRKPLLLSNVSSLPEVAGEAAIYFDPHQPSDIANAILRALTMTKKEQTEWINKGTQRLKLFSWQKTADEIETILNNILLS